MRNHIMERKAGYEGRSLCGKTGVSTSWNHDTCIACVRVANAREAKRDNVPTRRRRVQP